MEDSSGDISLIHTIQELVDSGFIIVGCEASTEPESECPCRGQGWPSCYSRVFLDYFFGCAAVDQVHGETFARDRDVDSRRS